MRELLRNLADMAHKNIVFSGTMDGTITANLENVTAEEALQAVVQADGLTVRDTGTTLILYDGSLKGRSPVAETFRLSYADAEEVADSLGLFIRTATSRGTAGPIPYSSAGPPRS